MSLTKADIDLLCLQGQLVRQSVVSDTILRLEARLHAAQCFGMADNTPGVMKQVLDVEVNLTSAEISVLKEVLLKLEKDTGTTSLS